MTLTLAILSRANGGWQGRPAKYEKPCKVLRMQIKYLKRKKEVAAAEEKKMFLLKETAQTPTDVLNFKWTAQRVEDAANLEAMPI